MPDILNVNKFLWSCLLFFSVNIMAWFQINGYKISAFMERHQIASTVLLGVPISLGFFYAWKLAYEGLGSLWSVRLLSFGLSFLVFPILTHFLLGETLFRPKIITCILLSIVIVMTQVYWPENNRGSYEYQVNNISQ